MSQTQNRLVDLFYNYASKLDLGEDVVEKALSIYNEARNKRCIRGYSTEELAAGIFFVACVSLSKDISIRDVSQVSSKSEGIIWSVAKTLQKRGVVKRIAAKRNMVNIMVRKLSGIIDQEDLNKLANMMNKKLENLRKIAGHVSPRAVLGAIVWLASKRKAIKIKITQREISRLFNVNEVSLREAAKRIKSSFFV